MYQAMGVQTFALIPCKIYTKSNIVSPKEPLWKEKRLQHACRTDVEYINTFEHKGRTLCDPLLWGAFVQISS